jgi:HSP20 family molecular chaperone IbpA
MKTQTWITETDLTANDLSLTIDRTGRLWKFRPTTAPHGTQPVDAHMTEAGIVLTVKVDGLESGDVDLCADGNVLEIRGRVDRTIGLACDVQMPEPVALSLIATEYVNGVLFVTVPPATAAELEDAVPECMPVAV